MFFGVIPASKARRESFGKILAPASRRGDRTSRNDISKELNVVIAQPIAPIIS